MPSRTEYPIGDRVYRVSMDPEDMLHHKLGRLLGRREVGERNEMGGLGEPINYCQNDSVAIRRREPSDKVQRYMRPGTMRDR